MNCPNPLPPDFELMEISPEDYFLQQGHSDVPQDWYHPPNGTDWHPVDWDADDFGQIQYFCK